MATQRLDKWLWYARFFKSRTLAATVCRDGGVRINRDRVDKSKASVRVGDVLTFAHGSYVRVIEVVGLGTRRGPATEARGLYQDLSPPETQPAVRGAAAMGPGARPSGAGRPTKRARRNIGAFTGRD